MKRKLKFIIRAVTSTAVLPIALAVMAFILLMLFIGDAITALYDDRANWDLSKEALEGCEFILRGMYRY